MKLNLAIEGRILDSIPLEANSLHNEYYLKAFRRLLVIRHQQTLATLNKRPEFFVEEKTAGKRVPLVPGQA